MIDAYAIQRIKEAAGIVDVISDFFELRKAGREYECLCPFHDDRHLGSFKISPRRNTYKCFACNASGGPIDFLMEYEGLSFPDALRWLGNKYGIVIDEEQDKFRNVKKAAPKHLHVVEESLPTLEIPESMVRYTEATREENTLAKWLRSLNWDDAQRARITPVLATYRLGNAKDGSTVFWQIDEDGHARTGKMMIYKPDGHRDKEAPRTWIHSKLKHSGWYDETRYTMRQTLFGMHLVNRFPSATLNIVESEKTALVMSVAYGGVLDRIWLATGGLYMLTKQNLQSLIDKGRHIVLYPDRDGVEAWTQRAQEIGYDRLTINAAPVLEWWRPEDGEKADVADVVLRYVRDPRSWKRKDLPKGMQRAGEVLKKMLDKNPAIQMLVNNLNLQVQ